MKRKILPILIITILIIFVWQFPLIKYISAQFIGQLSVIIKAKSIEKILNSAEYSEETKRKIKYIREVKIFAKNTLSLVDSESYQSFYDERGKTTLWNLSACKEFTLEAYEWSFPFFGSFPYKGFFNKNMALKEQERLIEKGYDTRLRSVGGWSTLGWFDDPILSNMLSRDAGQLAEVIIHEMTHSTIYIKNDATLSENLASVIGEIGAEEFLRHKFGDGSDEVIQYVNALDDQEKFRQHLIKGTRSLDSLLNNFTQTMSREEMRNDKRKMIQKIISTIDTISFINKDKYERLFKRRLPNNAYFMSFLRYNSQKDTLKEFFYAEFSGNTSDFLSYLKNTYSYL